MATNDHVRGNDPRGRKRERDKQNQRRKRKKEKDALQSLERRNRSLERQVHVLYDAAEGNVQHLSDMVKTLQARNQTLSERLIQANNFARLWVAQNSDHEDASTVQLNARDPLPVDRDCVGGFSNCRSGQALFGLDADGRSIFLKSTSYAIDDSQVHDLSGETVVSSAVGFADFNISSLNGQIDCIYQQPTPGEHSEAVSIRMRPDHDLIQQQTLHTPAHYSEASKLTVPIHKLERVLALPEWQRLPAKTEGLRKCLDPLGPMVQHLRTSPELFELCSPQPQALDLMFGGSLNELANAIFQSTTHTPLRRPEKLAATWMNYLITRWIIDPSQDNYHRIPSTFRPTTTQLFVPHAPVLDYIVWPQMRDNFIRHGMKYCRGEVLGLLFCTCRVRDSPNTDFVVRSGGGELQINPEFLERISDVEGWVLLRTFWTEYPELVVGLDPQRVMIFEKDLV
ncbi:uncharacterized protein Z518_07162 [Rhinocladiella mackenziei CBS 650.93]|uniref:BZIP domain-containing protein n=1 Tax=Rhinocladiella mackenziei CBS 650.93 TaxID=1442369 RepID=A0A0D2ICN0_9EURO|nr:uncharacterized protein Z518_07162 [Rhinocladiella mackenziei CBS 650.93]KIX03609.1 hypothetical protein Z518_07162 [Rhinocladiella mackenziei CBS 650.93]